MNMHHQTLEKMHELKLFGMADEFERQIANPSISEIPFERRIRILVDQEATFRDSKRLQVLLKKAKLQMQASVENIDYRSPRGVEKSQKI